MASRVAAAIFVLFLIFLRKLGIFCFFSELRLLLFGAELPVQLIQHLGVLNHHRHFLLAEAPRRRTPTFCHLHRGNRHAP